MRNVLVGLLWLWVAASLAIYGYRLYRRITKGPKGERPDADGPKVEGPRVEHRASGQDAPLISRLPDDTGPAPLSRAAPPPVAGSPRDVPQQTRPADGGRSGLFAAEPAVGAASESGWDRPGSEARATVAEMLRGIAMPCDLSPVVSSDRIMDPYRVAFSTDTTPAASVGAGVGDELERLGFALTSTAPNRLEATKEGATLTVTIHTDPTNVTVGDAPAYPTMPPGSVVVEFRV